MTRQTYVVPTNITLDDVKRILKGKQCSGIVCSRSIQCLSCVLQGTTKYVNGDNSLAYLDKTIFLQRLVDHEVITKAQALDLTLSG